VTTFSEQVWALLEAEDYTGARALLQARLDAEPDSHWVLTRLGTTYYEERRYEDALRFALRAHELAPKCPLVLWDLAGTREMLDHDDEALRLYDRLIERGVEQIATDECGEGRAWARGLVADAHYRRARILWAAGHRRAALRAFDAHLAMRGPGCRSIYDLKTVRSERAALG
jgi:tetratricopeptide (TPR) repeat protein